MTLMRLPMAMPVQHGTQQAVQQRTTTWEVDDEHAPAWCQHAPYFTEARLLLVSWKVVEHQTAQNDVEAGVFERQVFDRCYFEARRCGA